MIPVILKYLRPKDYAIGGLVIVLILVVTQWHKDATELKKAKLVYENPSVKTVEKIVYRTGPVRIKTVVVREKDGDEITTIDEEHEATSTETSSAKETAPVALSITLAPARTDRYLFSVGLNKLSMDMDGKAFFVGYGFKNRLDVEVGGVNKDGWSPWVLTTLRF